MILLRGRCRYCNSPISPRYALVEIATAIAFVGIYDAFYIMKMHSWFGGFPFDMPIFVAHLSLIAILIVCSAIDIEYYLIDIRITFVAFAIGMLCWAITPAEKLAAISSVSVINNSNFAGLMGAIIGFFIRNVMIKKNFGGEQDKSQDMKSEHIDNENVNIQAKSASVSTSAVSNKPAIIFLVIYFLGAIWIIFSLISADYSIDSYKLRMWEYCVWLFLAIIAGSIPRRQSDEQIIEAIEEEKYSARAVAFTELIYLTPIIIGFIFFWLIARYIPIATRLFHHILTLQIGIFAPIKGLAFSGMGILITSAFGWAVRIIFTLVFGKEAMGPGDIYILAAIGAIAGSAVAILGFFIGSVIGVFGICVLLLWKTSKALSYGPWIAIGAFVCMLGYNPIINYLKPAAKALSVVLLHNYGN